MMKSMTILALCVSTLLSAQQFTRDITNEIPIIEHNKFKKLPRMGGGDWSKAVGLARGITLDQAFRIAEEHPEITCFFYTTAFQMVLGTPANNGDYRLFRNGDTVFFTGEPVWGDAGPLADGYVKISN